MRLENGNSGCINGKLQQGGNRMSPFSLHRPIKGAIMATFTRTKQPGLYGDVSRRTTTSGQLTMGRSGQRPRITMIGDRMKQDENYSSEFRTQSCICMKLLSGNQREE